MCSMANLFDTNLRKLDAKKTFFAMNGYCEALAKIIF